MNAYTALALEIALWTTVIPMEKRFQFPRFLTMTTTQ